MAAGGMARADDVERIDIQIPGVSIQPDARPRICATISVKGVAGAVRELSTATEKPAAT